MFFFFLVIYCNFFTSKWLMWIHVCILWSMWFVIVLINPWDVKSTSKVPEIFNWSKMVY